jgi:ribosome modulation factor
MMATRQKRQLWIDGYRAYGAGVLLEHCPHADPDKADHWRRGWIVGKADHEALEKQRKAAEAKKRR